MKTKEQTPLFKFILCGLFFFSTFFSFAFSPSDKPLQLADINITGKVTSSENNEPLVGVSIRVEGTDKGTITDVDGNFTLTAPSDAVLLFTFIGFETQKVSVNNQAVINISLVNSASALSELVVIGYGSATKKDMTAYL